QILFARSTDCGVSWGVPQKISEGFLLNQGTNMAIDPGTGYVYIVWRQMTANGQPDAILWAVSTDGGKSFSKGLPLYTFAPGTAFDQGSSGTSFRATGLPAITAAP